jgi:hypothetical protein
MNRNIRLATGLVVVCGLLVIAAGCAARSSQSTTLLPSKADSPVESAIPPVGSSATQGGAAQSGSSGGQSTPTAADTLRIVIAKAAMSVEVGNLEKTVEQVRAITATAGGTISQLSYSQGSGGTPVTPQTSGSSAADQPSTAQLTLRVPASKLPEVERSVRALGNVLSQSAEESDVTQQHVDLVARIDNLKAEEVRLRSMLDKAKTVGEMLAVERELARVQGDIESMQAQLAYLDTQAAQATLTVALSEPGALVRPGSGGWGLGSAITTGVQAAAIILRTIIASLIAFSPLILLGLLVWLIVKLIRSRRRAAKEHAPQEPAE